MKANIKAKELLDKFYIGMINEIDAKQCALICVDEIIKEYEKYTNDYFKKKNMPYWQEVKQEIEKL